MNKSIFDSFLDVFSDNNVLFKDFDSLLKSFSTYKNALTESLELAKKEREETSESSSYRYRDHIYNVDYAIKSVENEDKYIMDKLRPLSLIGENILKDGNRLIVTVTVGDKTRTFYWDDKSCEFCELTDDSKSIKSRYSRHDDFIKYADNDEKTEAKKENVTERPTATVKTFADNLKEQIMKEDEESVEEGEEMQTYNPYVLVENVRNLIDDGNYERKYNDGNLIGIEMDFDDIVDEEEYCDEWNREFDFDKFTMLVQQKYGFGNCFVTPKKRGEETFYTVVCEF